MISSIISLLWGSLNKRELRKFAIFSLTLFFIIGAYWPIKTLKDSLFLIIIKNKFYLTHAKILSICFIFPLMYGYSLLLNRFKRSHVLFYVSMFYTIFGVLFSLCFAFVSNTWIIWSACWLFYLYSESYISLGYSIFWSLVNDSNTSQEAKKGYGIILFGGQLGGFLCTLLGRQMSYQIIDYKTLVPIIIMFSTVLMAMAGFFSVIIKKRTPDKTVPFDLHLQNDEKIIQDDGKVDLQDDEENNHNNSSSKGSSVTSFLQGFKMLIASPYVGTIAIIVSIKDCVITMLHFQMLIQADSTFAGNGLLINKFLYDYALGVQTIACLFSLIGTSFLQRKLGIRACITIYPLGIGFAFCYYLINPKLSIIFIVMLLVRALNYAFNNPSKEILYIPTDTTIKYKSKIWIDTFGSRFGKASGSLFNNFNRLTTSLTQGITLLLIATWSCLAYQLGTSFNKKIKKQPFSKI